ncbi:ferritin-like domain-containing protein [Granulicella arctica]|uniref:Ferritin-like domain-containing protein n=1 Tax=Granulicella arctica TaxID=940613 RepID=A0A7Y9PEE1_9BACT|nr:hypothetical protein [Granulicella arctica]
MEKKLSDLVDKALSRRSFLAGAGSVAAGTLVAGCSSGTPATTTPATTTPTPTTTATPTIGDVDVLNFALNLEYLEAEFYLRAATGQGLSAADSGNTTSLTVGGAAVLGLTTAQQNYIYEIAMNELDHVRFLRSALSTAAVSAPAIDLTNSFNAAASAAGIGSSFNPFASYQAFLVGAFVFEDVGVTAYHGAAGLLSSKTNLGYAASIMAVEAYHAGEIRTLLIADSVKNATMTSTTVSPDNTYIGYANKISALRAKLDGSANGGNETPITPLPPYAIPFVPTAYTPASSIVAADSTNSIAFSRSTDEVLHIVYAAAPGAGVKGGGFFPNGLNGLISVTAS